MSNFTIGQSPSAHAGSDLAAKAQAGGWYPLLLIGGVLLLVAVFVLLVRMHRDS
jgi:hypothetical protein